MRQTDNSFLADKVFLRLNHLPEKEEIFVLDCFSGTGKIWSSISQLSKKKIKILSLDRVKKQRKIVLTGNNIDFLSSLMLDKFDVIDLDAYGIPYEQLKILFQRNYRGRVFVTFIQSIHGAMNRGLFLDIGITSEMIKKCPTVFYKRGWEFFLEWLSVNGVDEIFHRSHDRKHYLFFEL